MVSTLVLAQIIDCVIQCNYLSKICAVFRRFSVLVGGAAFLACIFSPRSRRCENAGSLELVSARAKYNATVCPSHQETWTLNRTRRTSRLRRYEQELDAVVFQKVSLFKKRSQFLWCMSDQKMVIDDKKNDIS